MNLGVFLSIGESFEDYRNKGQYDLIIDYLLSNYSKNFDKVFVFSYADETFTIFGNVFILPNKWRLNRFFYSTLAPILYWKKVQSCTVLRGLQLTGGIPCLIAKVLFQKPYVINYGYIYDQFAWIEGKWWQALLYQLLQWPVLRCANKIIITARYLAQHINHICKKDRIVVIPNGVDTTTFTPRRIRKTIDILFIGRLERQKNIGALLQAVLLCGQKFTVVLVGDGSQKGLLQKKASEYDINCEFRGSLSHAKLPFILNSSKIFVLPSIIEGNPKVLLEALACGIPIIASDIKAHREIIKKGQHGILCKPDAQALSLALQKLMKDQKLQTKFSINARKYAVAHFTKELLNKKEIKVLLTAAQQ